VDTRVPVEGIDVLGHCAVTTPRQRTEVCDDQVHAVAMGAAFNDNHGSADRGCRPVTSVAGRSGCY